MNANFKEIDFELERRSQLIREMKAELDSLRALNQQLVEALENQVACWNIAQDMQWKRLGLPRPADDDTEPIRIAKAALDAAKATGEGR